MRKLRLATRWLRTQLSSADWPRAIVYIVLSLSLVGWVIIDASRTDVDLRATLALPHPLNILNEKRRGALHALDGAGRVAFERPGYTAIQPGTFRDKYPSSSLAGQGTFDEVFVITSEKCGEQFEEFSRRARAIDLKFTKVTVKPSREINIENPPLPIANSSFLAKGMNHAQLAIFKRQIGYTWAHHEIWQNAVRRKRQRIMVIDDTLFPRDRLVRSLPQLFNLVDQESIAGQNPWHFMFFRRTIMNRDWNALNETLWVGHESVWAPNPRYNHPVVRSKPSYGVGFYAMSSQGVDWVLRHFEAYEAPIDVQIALLQQRYPRDFVALSACNNDEPKPLCPEIVQDIRVGSATDYDCVWRRVQEGKLTQEESPSA